MALRRPAEPLALAVALAVRYWHIEPARVDGQAVAAKVVLQLDFKLT